MTNFRELPNNPINNGIQYLFKAPNNYGASIVRHDFSYGNSQGLWELAVLKYEENETNLHNFEICYTTPITEDVLGYLTESDINETLDKISALPNPYK